MKRSLLVLFMVGLFSASSLHGQASIHFDKTKSQTLKGMKSLSVKEEVSWSRNVEEHLALLQQSATSTRQEPGKSRPTFEVASVRPSRNVLPKGGAGRGGFLEGCSGNPVELDPGRFTALNTTLPTMISLAYSEIRLSAKNYALDCATLNMLNLLSGGPDWIKSVEAGQFDIQAVIPAGSPRYKLNDLLGGNAPALQQMLQALLEDRFKLVLGRETKEMPVYFLSVAKSGPKFNGSRQDLSRGGKPRVHITEDDSGNLVRSTESSQGIRFGRSQDQNGSTYIRLDANRTPMSELVLALHRASGRLVIDRTGLMGEYTFYLDYSENGVGRPPVTSVLQEIGLELKDGRAPVDVWIINHVEKPSDN